MHRLPNQTIAQTLSEMGLFYEMQDVDFKPRAYEKAALAIEALGEEVADIYEKGGVGALTEISGVGKGIAEHIEDMLTTGHFREYERLKKKTPVEIAELTEVEGVGPQTVKTLWKKLGIKNREELEKAARENKIREIEGFGEKSEEKILKGIAFLKSSGGRRILGFVLPEIREMEERIAGLDGVERVTIAGSVRRRKETIGDIDILVVSSNPEKTTKQFIELPSVAHVYGSGETKTNVRLKNGLDADLRIVPERSWGAALNYFTGSKAHNIELRTIAQKNGWKLNEYGLFSESDGTERFLVGKTEEEVYKKLGLRPIEPELREMTGEIEAARDGTLPDIIGYDALKGDLQVQTDWTDGADSMKEMALAAKKHGLSYIAITDHTQSLAMAGGADEKKLRRQMKAIDDLNEELDGFTVLKGAEVNVMKDGSLDIKDEVLAELDVVGVGVHSYFNLSRKEQMARLAKAMENPHVDIIFHLTGRLINKRPPIDIDIEEIVAIAKKTGTVLEIDAFPDRSDIRDEYIRACVEAGVKMSIDSDAHSAKHFEVLEHGIAQARRGWSTESDIINTMSVTKLKKELQKPKEERWR